MEDDVRDQQISRRRMLKRIGVGTAVAWSTPILTSIGVPAFAASGSCVPAKQFCGPPDPKCGAPGVACNIPPGCNSNDACTEMLDSSCLCWDFAFCTSPNPVCQQDSDCGAGFKCGFVDPACNNLCAGNVGCFHSCMSGGSIPRSRPGRTVVRA